MQIKRFYARHFKGIREVEIFADEINEIAGPNGAGKSSVLDGILAALAGQKHIDLKPLREGETKGEVQIELDDLIITRKFSEGKTSSLTIKAADGSRKGQRDLDDLFSGFTFDPLAFSRMKPREQIEVIQKLAGAEFCKELQGTDAAIAKTMEDRAEVNRDLKRMGAIVEVPKVEPVDVSALVAELKSIEEWNKKQDVRLTEFTALETQRIITEDRIEELQKELLEINQKIANLPEQQSTMAATAIQLKISEAGATNQQALAYQQYLQRMEEHKKLTQDSLRLDRGIEKLRDLREGLARSVKLPIEGITFTDDGLRVNGIPFEQLASSEKIRISCYLGMEANNPLKIMFVRDGSLLDAKSFDELVLARSRKGYQLWIETVGEGHGDAIQLEEGEIKSKEAF